MMQAHPIEAFTPKRSTSLGTSVNLPPSRRGEERGEMPGQVRRDTSDRDRKQGRDLAREIMSFLPEGTWDLVGDDSGLMRFNVRIKPHDWKLEWILFSKPCLERLSVDPLRAIKIGYLQRDIQNQARSRRTYAYPHSALSQLTGS